MPQEQETFDVKMPDGTIIQGVPSGTTQSEVMRRYRKSLPAEKPRSLAGSIANTVVSSVDALSRAGSSFSQQMLGVSGPMEAISNIGQTLQMSPEELASGIKEFGTQAGKGLAKGAIDLFSLTTPGMAIRSLAGKTPPKPEEAFSLLGGQSIAAAGRQAGSGQYAEAVGSTLAGLTQAALWFLPFKARPSTGTVQTLKTLEAGKATLATGQEVATTPGMVLGGKTAVTEQMVSRIPGGGAVGKQAENAISSVQGAMSDIIAAEGGDAKTLLNSIAKNPATAAVAVGKAMRKMASNKYYDPVSKAMATAGAAIPEMQEVAKVASFWSKSERLQSMLLKNPDISPTVKDALGRLSMAPNSVRAIEMSGIASQEFVEGALGDLKAAARKPNISNYDRKILHELTDTVDKASLDAVRKTGGQELVDKLLAGRSLVSQGYAMEETGNVLRDILEPGKQSTIPGAARTPASVNVEKLKAAMEELSYARPFLKNEVPTKSTLGRAFLSPAREQAFQQAAELVVKGGRSGNLTAAHFGILGEIYSTGAVPGAVAGYAAAGIAGGLAGGLVAGAATLPLGAWIISKALTKPYLWKTTLAFLRSAPGTVTYTTLAQKVARGVEEPSTRSLAKD